MLPPHQDRFLKLYQLAVRWGVDKSYYYDREVERLSKERGVSVVKFLNRKGVRLSEVLEAEERLGISPLEETEPSNPANGKVLSPEDLRERWGLRSSGAAHVRAKRLGLGAMRVYGYRIEDVLELEKRLEQGTDQG